MLKRLRWFLLGFIAGFVAFVYLRDKIHSLQNQYAAVRGTTTVVRTIRDIRRDLQDAWTGGRNKIRDAEQRLRVNRAA